MASCMDIINNMTKLVKNANTELIKNMIATNVQYEDVCVRPNLTYDHYYEVLSLLLIT